MNLRYFSPVTSILALRRSSLFYNYDKCIFFGGASTLTTGPNGIGSHWLLLKKINIFGWLPPRPKKLKKAAKPGDPRGVEVTSESRNLSWLRSAHANGRCPHRSVTLIFYFREDQLDERRCWAVEQLLRNSPNTDEQAPSPAPISIFFSAGPPKKNRFPYEPNMQVVSRPLERLVGRVSRLIL